ncbi:hypothetical protein CHS0354_017896 [Potamilus streckersoni]|uniref:Protein phosphatase 1 regulatory subunit 7 n=1 Tax=Potamilus streckersoni TaxID=2493646 RepID=A0AAE0T2M7_9BIVA|nr:hypothetical protein CHS0354_017896 [Potamilus streckersoni]
METGKLTGPIVLARTRAPDLESVKKLNCWGSEIEDISVVRTMPNLEICSVSVNDIATLEDFSYCPNLQELYIRKNKIEDLSEICYLKNLQNLRILWLADNPCEEKAGAKYRITVLRNLPNLQKLDNIVVQEEERNKALEEGEELSLPVKEEVPEEPPADENGAKPKLTTIGRKDHEEEEFDPVTLSWEETNKIREQLGLKPLPFAKMTSPKHSISISAKARNAHILQAVLILIKELDRDSLEIIDMCIKKKLESM